jgi:hypothetical protein
MPPSSTPSRTVRDRSTPDPRAWRRRRSWLIALVVLVPALATVEVLVRRLERPKAALQIDNQGDGPMQDLVVTYGDTRMPVGTLLRGRSARLRMTVGPMGPLRLDFRQKDSPIQSFWVPDYDPAQNLEDGFKQVLVVGGLQIQRYAEEDDAPEDPEAPWTRFKRWVQDQMSNPFP